MIYSVWSHWQQGQRRSRTSSSTSSGSLYKVSVWVVGSDLYVKGEQPKVWSCLGWITFGFQFLLQGYWKSCQETSSLTLASLTFSLFLWSAWNSISIPWGLLFQQSDSQSESTSISSEYPHSCPDFYQKTSIKGYTFSFKYHFNNIWCLASI